MPEVIATCQEKTTSFLCVLQGQNITIYGVIQYLVVAKPEMPFSRIRLKTLRMTSSEQQ